MVLGKAGIGREESEATSSLVWPRIRMLTARSTLCGVWGVCYLLPLTGEWQHATPGLLTQCHLLSAAEDP